MQYIKILSYDIYGGEMANRFERVCSILNQTIDPPSLEMGTFDGGGKTVFCSPRLRAITTINQKTVSSVIVEPALNEIPFDLKKYCTESEFNEYGSTIVRKAFLHLFSTNNLLISHKALQAELDHLIDLSSANHEAIAISHTFRLRLMQIYIATNKTLFQQPEKIYDFLDPTKHWLDFGGEVEM